MYVSWNSPNYIEHVLYQIYIVLAMLIIAMLTIAMLLAEIIIAMLLARPTSYSHCRQDVRSPHCIALSDQERPIAATL